MTDFEPPITYHQFYVDQGNGDPVLILHGLFADLRKWQPVVEQFKKNHRVMIARLPIFQPSEHSNLDRAIAVLKQFIDYHALTNVILVGEPGVGKLAEQFAKEYPQTIQRIYVGDRERMADLVLEPAVAH